MKKVGFITSPLTSGHSVRGVGFYTKRLLDPLHKQASEFNLKIIDINDPSQINSQKLDLVHYPYFDLFFHTLPIFQSLPFVVTVHDVIPLEYPDHYPPGKKGRFNLWLQQLALHRSRKVITDSYASIKSLRKYMHLPHEMMRLIYLAADGKYRPLKDESILNKVRIKFKLPKKFVLYVGDVNYNKNVIALVKACRLNHTPLVIVGKQAAQLETLDVSHPELSHLTELKAEMAKARVIRLGFVSDEDLVAVYNLATVYCQPSFAEGFGLPVLEAMSCGTPVASSHSHSLPEIGGTAALYFDPHDIKQFKSILNQLLTDSQLRQKLSEEGIAQSGKFTWEQTARETLQTYQEII
jgi:glycosyltransferase involved in cell wall biosynthesis